MALSPGTRLGPYEILAAIGAGGMGEVYRARDTRLDRIVALKVLPDALAADPQFKERFDREARTISQLEHPHICALYDVGNTEGTAFLIMQFLEGETLERRLQRGALAWNDALKTAIEIASALDAAHRAGVVHRDLKPGNIMMTKSGAKLLDFGLAKAGGAVMAGSGASMAPTTPPSLTAQGTILGTFQYMAPEQLDGTEADARTDIFAFGAVLYETLTGRKAFQGKSHASLIAAIMSSEPPPISAVQPVAPPALDRLVRTCLAKDPDERWQTARDLERELKWITGGQSQSSAVSPASQRPLEDHRPPPIAHRPRIGWPALAAILGLISAAAIALGAYGYFIRAQPDVQTMRFFVSPPDGWGLALDTLSSGQVPNPLAVSPDGRRVASIARKADGDTQIWIRALDTLAAQPLAGTEGASSPFWSPDSRFIAFFAGRKVKKIDIAGGPALTLCDAGDNGSGAWSRDGIILFASVNLPLNKVAAAGGTPTAATTLGNGEATHTRPMFLPDGRHFLYRALIGAGPGPIFVASLDSATERTHLMDSGSTNVVYTQGHLLFLRDTTLMAQPFDAQRLTLGGEAFPVAEQIQIQAIGGIASGVFSASQNGVLAYQTGTTAAGINQLTWVDRTGKPASTVADAALYGDVNLSADGKHASVSVTDPALQTRDIWLIDLARGLRTRFTSDPADEELGVWSPDGARVVFNSRRTAHQDLYLKDSNGAKDAEVLLADDQNKTATSWSPDGRFILYTVAGGAQTSNDLWILPLAGDKKPYPFLQTRFGESYGQFSPDGRWIAYQSSASGTIQVYVRPFPGPGGAVQVSTTGGSFPRWRHDGKEIFYLNAESKLMAATVNGQGTSFEVGAVSPLFTVRQSGGRNFYDVAPDGQRFLVNGGAADTSTPTPITVVVNWLKK